MKKLLPKNWVEVSLKEVTNNRKGKKPNVQSEVEFEGSVPYMDIKALEYNKIRQYADIKSSKLFEEGDVAMVWDGARSGWVSKTNFGAIGSTLVAFNPILFNSNYLFYYLLEKYPFLNSNARGVGIPHVDPTVLWDLKFPLPPLLEQNRIVAKLDALFSQLETIKTSMANVPLLLKDFRQQVLTQAVTGKLTEQWRKGKKLKVWENVELNKVIPKGGIFDGPFGSNLKTEDYIDQGVRVVRLENIEHLGFIGNKETYVSDEKHQKLIRHNVVEGDIIFSSFISENIRACILPKLETKAIAKADCFCIRPDETIIDKKFLLYILVSNITYSQLTSHIHGATRPRINTTQLKTIRIPLVSLKEQEEIVRRVESLFAKADAIEQQYKSLKEKIDNLPQALLHKAFKGELTEQLDSDGDARELLQQIQELKGTTTKVGKSTKLERLKEFNRKIKSYRENDGVLGMVAEK